MVIKHQQNAGERQHDEQIKCYAAHSPGEVIADGVAIDLGRMKVKENVAQYAEGSIARFFVVLDTKNGAIELSFVGLLQLFELIFGLSLNGFLQGLCGVLNLIEDTGFAAISAVAAITARRVLFVRH